MTSSTTSKRFKRTLNFDEESNEEERTESTGIKLITSLDGFSVSSSPAQTSSMEEEEEEEVTEVVNVLPPPSPRVTKRKMVCDRPKRELKFIPCKITACFEQNAMVLRQHVSGVFSANQNFKHCALHPGGCNQEHYLLTNSQSISNGKMILACGWDIEDYNVYVIGAKEQYYVTFKQLHSDESIPVVTLHEYDSLSMKKLYALGRMIYYIRPDHFVAHYVSTMLLKSKPNLFAFLTYVKDHQEHVTQKYEKLHDRIAELHLSDEQVDKLTDQDIQLMLKDQQAHFQKITDDNNQLIRPKRTSFDDMEQKITDEDIRLFVDTNFLEQF